MTYSIAEIVVHDNLNLTVKLIEDRNGAMITALVTAVKDDASTGIQKIYESLQQDPTRNRVALMKAGLLHKPLDVYVALDANGKTTAFCLLSLLAAHIPGQ